VGPPDPQGPGACLVNQRQGNRSTVPFLWRARKLISSGLLTVAAQPLRPPPNQRFFRAVPHGRRGDHPQTVKKPTTASL